MPAACIALLAALGLLLAGCGGGGGGGGGGAAPATRTAASSPAAATPATGATMTGTGYALHLTGSWRDASKEDTGLATAPNLVLASADPQGVMLVTLDQQAKGVSAAQLQRTIRSSEVDRDGVSRVADDAPVTLDGDRGISYRFDTTSAAGVKLRTREVVVVHGRVGFTALLTAPAARFDAPDAQFASMLASWRWTAATG